MTEVTGVDCKFDVDGRIQVRRIKLPQGWLTVEQGRQWVDEQGHHVLVSTPGAAVQELLLSRDTLQWQTLARYGGPPVV